MTPKAEKQLRIIFGLAGVVSAVVAVAVFIKNRQLHKQNLVNARLDTQLKELELAQKMKMAA